MSTQNYTAAIIGGGPAGCQCALWLKMLGYEPVIIELTDHLGGLQAESPYQNQWVVGLMSTSGRELAENMQKHIETIGVPVLFRSSVSSFLQQPQGFLLDIDGKSITANYIVLATGSRQHEDALPTGTPLSPLSQASHDHLYASIDTSKKNGWEANLPSAFADLTQQLIDQDGYLKTNKEGQTPVAGIFAVGEAANRMHPCVVTSMADGVVVAKAIQALLG